MRDVILFDLMDTLVQLPQKPKHLVFRRLGFETVDEFDDFVEDLTIQSPGLTTDQFFDRMRLLKPTLSKATITAARKDWLQCLERATYYDDALPTLKKLRSSGNRLAIISNTLPPTHALVDGLDLYRHVDHVFLSCDVGSWKPNRQIFASALGAMSGKPLSAVMVGNKIATDIVGAIDSGIAPILVRRTGEADEEITVQGQLVPSIQSLSEIPRILAKLSFGSFGEGKRRQAHE